MAVNLDGTYYCIKAFLPELRKLGSLGLVTMEKVEVLLPEEAAK